jgi:hypothetical protein
MAIEVLMGTARLDDAEGVERFIKSMPNGDTLRGKLAPGERGRFEQYDNTTKSARFLTVDGVSFVCFVVTDITPLQAQLISGRCEDLVEWSVEQFHRLLERALNVTFPKAV